MTNIPKKGRAFVLTAPGQFEVKDVTVPTPCYQEVLCQIHAVAICGSDPEIIRGDLAGIWPPTYPFIAGHEWAGQVVALGEGVTAFKVGDRVAGEAHKGCGYCENCLEGRYTLCLNYGNIEAGHAHYGFIVDGAYTQYQKYSIKSIKHMPDNVSFSEGAMVDTASVALHGLELAGIKAGGTSVIIGPGPIGLCAMRLSKEMGSGKVIMVGRGVRLGVAKSLGAEEVIDFTSENVLERVLELTDGLGADQVFECSGAAGTLTQAISLARKGGSISLLGVATDDVREEIPFKYVTHNELTIYGSRANPNTAEKVLRLFSSGKLNVKEMITHHFDLENFQEALDTYVQRKDGAVKIVILPNGQED